jgi:hypothetical protein
MSVAEKTEKSTRIWNLIPPPPQVTLISIGVYRQKDGGREQSGKAGQIASTLQTGRRQTVLLMVKSGWLLRLTQAHLQ